MMLEVYAMPDSSSPIVKRKIIQDWMHKELGWALSLHEITDRHLADPVPFALSMQANPEAACRLWANMITNIYLNHVGRIVTVPPAQVDVVSFKPYFMGGSPALCLVEGQRAKDGLMFLTDNAEASNILAHMSEADLLGLLHKLSEQGLMEHNIWLKALLHTDPLTDESRDEMRQTYHPTIAEKLINLIEICQTEAWVNTTIDADALLQALPKKRRRPKIIRR